MDLATTPAATLAEMVSGTAQARDASDLVEELLEELEVAAHALFTRFPWDQGSPWHLSKTNLSALGGCRRRAALAPRAGSWNRALVVGTIADAALKSHLFSDAGDGHRVEAALARLDAAGSGGAAGWLGSVSVERRQRVCDEAEAAAATLAAFWPHPMSERLWLRVDEPLSVPLLDGSLVLAGRPDVTLSGPPTDAPCTLVEVKARNLHAQYRNEMEFYALLATLRDRQLPAHLVVLCGSGEHSVDPVQPDSVRAAARRVVGALRTAEALSVDQATGRVLATMPSGLCRWCDGRFWCDGGRVWLEENGLALCLDSEVDPDDLQCTDDAGYSDNGADEPL